MDDHTASSAARLVGHSVAGWSGPVWNRQRSDRDPVDAQGELLARIRGNRSLRRRLGELAASEPNAVAAGLRTHDMIIVCDHDAWAVESDTTRIELAPATILGFAASAVPAQRGGR